jgi:hypothetical protein
MSKVLIIDASGYTSGINVPHAASRMIVEVVYPEQSQHKDHPLLQNPELNYYSRKKFELLSQQDDSCNHFPLNLYQTLKHSIHLGSNLIFHHLK